MKVGDLVRHHDQLYPGVGLVLAVAKSSLAEHGDARVQYSDITDWIAIEDLEIVNESR
jgi:hypothetical protein|tara:strand:+ start:314 stop:487 length:174 start_codon:yes stop_codon:yes gene_type:complete